MVIVFLACVALTELLARTALAKPLTGRTRVPWRRPSGPRAPAAPHEVQTDADADADADANDQPVPVGVEVEVARG
jgi:hypothetical protein